MAGGSFISIIRVSLFLLAVWTGGKVSKWIKISTIPAEIAVGVVSAPALRIACLTSSLVGLVQCSPTGTEIDVSTSARD